MALGFRQDLITDEAGQRMWAALFARLLPQAYQRLTSLHVPSEPEASILAVHFDKHVTINIA